MMMEESGNGNAGNSTEKIGQDDADMTIPIQDSGMDRTIRIENPEKPAGKTKKDALSSTSTLTLGNAARDFSSALQTSSRILNMLMGKKLRNVDAEIESEGKSRNDDAPLWDGEGETFGNVFSLYEKREDFASGGQGILSYAYDRSLRRVVALKSLRKEQLDKVASRKDFIREARITASLDHPSIIPVYHLCGDDKNGLHLSMKILHGISLKKYLEEICLRYQSAGVGNFNETDSLHHRIDIFLQICDAMEYVQNKKVIHGDLKPENIMIGEYHECYIMDWGIARPAVSDAPLAEDARIVGTPRYIAPELLNGGPDGLQSDIYSLGVILFEMVTLRAAFDGETSSEVLSKVKVGAFNPLRHRFKSRIPHDLAAIIRKATCMDLSKRYQTVKALSEDLRRFLLGQEVFANPDGKIGKVVRWANHHSKMLLLIMLLLAFSSIAASTIGILETVAKNSEKERLVAGAEQYSYSKVRQNVIAMQMLLDHVAGELAMLHSDAALLLSLPPLPGASVSPDFCPVEDVRSLCWEKGNSFSPDLTSPGFFTYGAPLYFGGVSYLVPPKENLQEARKDLARLSPVIPRLKRTVLNSGITLSSHVSDQERIEAYKKGGMPVIFAYLSLAKNGLHLNYPAKSDYSKGYDPRTRPWYKNALGKGTDLVWSAPYHATGTKAALMITASVELVDGRNQSYGVAGVDIPLAIFARFLTQNPEAGFYTIHRMLIDEKGQIVLQADGNGKTIEMSPFEENAEGVPVLKIFPDAALLKRIRKHAYGSVIVPEKGRKIAYVYSSIPALRWSYVEVLDWGKLLNYPHLAY